MKTKITETGNNLTVRIICPESSRVYDWLTFATWYTCCRTMPDAKFNLSAPKSASKEILFSWLDRCKIKKVPENHPFASPTLILVPQTIQLRAFYEEELEQINSGMKIISDQCEIYQNGNSVKKVDWLSSKNISENPVFLTTSEIIGTLDVRNWASQSRDPIFSAKWESKNPEEKLVQQNWSRMGMYYAMANR